MDATERNARLLLLLTPGLGPTLVNRCIEHFGSAEEVLRLSSRDLAIIDGIAATRAKRIHESLHELEREGAAIAERERAEQAGVQLIALDDEVYPRLLRHIPDPPPMLWVRGELRSEDALALGMVGLRKCSPYGREQADRFALQCAEAGLCIVSGGAYGIDAAAHRAALRPRPHHCRHRFRPGRSLSRSPCGVVPSDRGRGSRGAGGGAVISELPMLTPPRAEHFPRRNRIISGLSLGVLVIEAAKRSGALITARLCVEEHGRELMAVPGRVDSRASEGCHKMIREGWATLVTNAADVLDGLGEAGQLLKEGLTTDDEPTEAPPASASLFEQNLTDTQQKIVAALEQPRTLDQLTAWTGLPASQVQADLTMLEIRGTLRREQGLFHRRK